jgi:hypothetical protein
MLIFTNATNYFILLKFRNPFDDFRSGWIYFLYVLE